MATSSPIPPILSYTSTPGLKEGTVIVRLTGPLTLSNIFDFQTEFRAMKPPCLILDLADSPYMDSAGLGLLMNQYVSAEAGNRKFFISGVSARIEALLVLTKVHRILHVFPTTAEAEAAA